MLRLEFNDLKIALHELSEICRMASFVFLIPVIFIFLYAQEYSVEYLLQKISVFAIPCAILYTLHIIFRKLHIEHKAKTKHILMTISIAWLLIAAIGSLPYILSDTLPPIDALFESMSGWTTTGMTMIDYPENLLEEKKDILLYRSLTQWIGGVGIVVLTLIFFLREGTAAIEYYSSEVGSLKIKPRIRNTIIETWKIYILYTVACIILLYMAEMNLFDAINHSLTALPTGGFSTHSESISYYQNPLVEFILIIFMMVGGVSFIIHYRIFEGKHSHILKNIEFRYMILLIVTVTCISFFLFSGNNDVFGNLRTSLFQAVSILTTTGFGTSDIAYWPALTQTLLLLLMLIGGSYGSTGSGIKVLRVVVIIKTIGYSIKKIMLPKSAMVRLKVAENSLNYDEITNVFAFFTAYLIIVFLGACIVAELGYGGYESLSISLSAMSNVGPTYLPLFTEEPDGSLQPNPGWFEMPDVGKITLILLMWIGRLEIFPALIIFTGFFRMKKKKR